MKLIREVADNIEYIEEAVSENKKALYITGPFMEAGIKNRNGRIYPVGVMGKEVSRYTKEVVESNRAYGELNHPSGPQINLERACILIKELKMQSDGKVMGKARVTETPSGNIVRGLMESGANLGVSSRALGSVKQNNQGIMEVQSDFRIITPSDVVADPSAPNAFVQGIMENVEYFFNEETGEFFEQCKKEMRRKKISRLNVSEELENKYYKFFEHIIKNV